MSVNTPAPGAPTAAQLAAALSPRHNALANDIHFRGLKYRAGDQVRILPPFGINDTSENRHSYEANYKNRIGIVVSTRIKAVQLAAEVNGQRSIDAEEVLVKIVDKEHYFYSWFLKRYDGLEVVFDVLETISPTVE